MSNGYEETRVIVDGALVENYAFELGDTSEEVARRYHATNSGKLIGDYLKLRELVRDMLPFANESFEIDCPMKRCWLYKEGECDKPFVACRVGELTRKRVRDLGIEDG